MSAFEMIENETDGAVIKVVGVGGAGGNAVNHMISRGVQGVEFIAVNTDRQALKRSLAPSVIQLGDAGLGAGANPGAGRAACEKEREQVKAALAGANMVFITAGMGKGTGTGASPVVAAVAKELGILTVGVVTKPFEFEGSKKMRIADEGLEQLAEHVDSLIVVLNQKLFEVMDEDASLEDAFVRADDVLHNAVAGIAEIINVPGLVNVDFADVQTIMGEQGKAMMGIGEAAGLDRACPLQDMPVCLARRMRERRRNGQERGSGMSQGAIELREPQVVADAEPKPPPGRVRNDGALAPAEVPRLAIHLAIRQVHVEHVDLVIACTDGAVGSDQERAVGTLPLAHLDGHRPDEQPHAQLFRRVAECKQRRILILDMYLGKEAVTLGFEEHRDFGRRNE
jgi:cell division protein FtsZ